MDNAIFLRRNEDGKLKKAASLEVADYVRIPASDYVPISDWNALVDEYKVLSSEYDNLRQTNDDVATVTIPKEEYNGLHNMLRILKDRSLQQIDRAKADRWGYVFKYCDHRVFDRTKSDQKAYLITKTTPVSLKIDFKSAYLMISHDLQKLYHYINLERVITASYIRPSQIKPADFLLAISQRDDPDYNYDFYCDNSDYGRKIKELLDDSPDEIIFEIIKLGSNIGQGVYELSYWATKPI